MNEMKPETPTAWAEYMRQYKLRAANNRCGCGRPAVKHNATGFVCAGCAQPASHRVSHRLGMARLSEKAHDMWERHFGPWKLTPGVGFGPWQELERRLT